MRKMVAFLNSYTQGKSGGDICFIEIAKRLKKFNKIIVTSLLGKKLCEEAGLEADYIVTTREKKFNNVIITYIRRIFKGLMCNIKSDLIYATSDFLPDVLPALRIKMKNRYVKWIQKVFHLIPPKRTIPFYAQKASHFFIKYFADLIIVDNTLLKKDLEKMGFNPTHIIVNPPGINSEYFYNIKPSEDIKYDGVFLARLHPSKGIYDLIKIWEYVCKILPKAKLAVIGHGDNRTKRCLKQRIEGEGLKENIDILGHLPDSEAFGIVKSSRLFIFPSYEEGFGIVIAEAMACGLPVVVYDLPVYKEYFEKGIVRIPIGNTEVFAKAIMDLLRNLDMYLNLKGEAIEVCKKFNWDDVYKAELSYIDKICL